MENILKKTVSSSFVIVFAVLFLAAAAAAYYFYGQLNELKLNPQRAAQEGVSDVVKRVGELIVLPEGETPTVATVTDPERLKAQPFFERAKVGDRVLIYTNARKAILYDPAAHKIVEVAPVNIGPQQ
ncbi:MAG: hypothetical protein Q8R12_01275 [bacterium]|nr:hypothetical protein [bacterium]